MTNPFIELMGTYSEQPSDISPVNLDFTIRTGMSFKLKFDILDIINSRILKLVRLLI
jgi:hypothetical protein